MTWHGGTRIQASLQLIFENVVKPTLDCNHQSPSWQEFIQVVANWTVLTRRRYRRRAHLIWLLLYHGTGNIIIDIIFLGPSVTWIQLYYFVSFTSCLKGQRIRGGSYLQVNWFQTPAAATVWNLDCFPSNMCQCIFCLTTRTFRDIARSLDSWLL